MCCGLCIGDCRWQEGEQARSEKVDIGIFFFSSFGQSCSFGGAGHFFTKGSFSSEHRIQMASPKGDVFPGACSKNAVFRERPKSDPLTR